MSEKIKNLVIACMAVGALFITGCCITENKCEADALKKYADVKQIFPPASDRAAWAEVWKRSHNVKLKAEVLKRAEKIMKEPVPDIPAQLFMEYTRNGNRSRYAAPFYGRRQNLTVLALAETLEYKGRYIDKIMDYMWAIVSEPTWVIPAHCRLTKDPFPQFPVEIVDLFGSETGLTLALVMNFVEKEVAAVSPNFVKLVRDSIIRHIAVPLEEAPAPFWFEGLNNWTPWCCSNSLGAIVWALKEQPERRAKLINTLHTAVKNYISLYPEDGSCFEGPSYWDASPGMMLYFLEQLGQWPDDPKVKVMAEYIADTRMTAEYVMNFGDCGAKSINMPWQLYRFGERLNSDKLKTKGLENLEKTKLSTALSRTMHTLSYMFWLPENKEKKEFSSNPVSFYKKSQFFIMRQNGATLAAKRGHAWSHHHLDIGHFMLFFKDKPIIVDLGATEYTRDTFTDKRYQNPIMNSEGHNILHFNNIGQMELAPAAPGTMKCSEDENFIRCTMDLTAAYKPEAKLKSYIRELVYDRKNRILNVQDSWELETDNNNLYANFFTPSEVIEKDGKLFIGGVPVTLKNCKAAVEKLKVTDSAQLRNWGKSMNMIKIYKKSGKKGNLLLSFDLK